MAPSVTQTVLEKPTSFWLRENPHPSSGKLREFSLQLAMKYNKLSTVKTFESRKLEQSRPPRIDCAMLGLTIQT